MILGQNDSRRELPPVVTAVPGRYAVVIALWILLDGWLPLPLYKLQLGGW